MRITVVDREETISLVAPFHAVKMLTAACSRRPEDHRALLALAEEYDPRLLGGIVRELSRVDAPRSPGVPTTPDALPHEGVAAEARPFRVVDEATRRRSLEPANGGLVVFNLPAKRIVQVQNSLADLRRKDRGRLRRDGRPVRALYSYELPADWSIVP